ncbi:MAG: hypothetical protein K2J83_02840 [Clostridia bacterium]|nr:hypothetical protein [Clostridia bacterium]
MSKESIVERIISDAEEERNRIISEARKKAEETLESANESARRKYLGVQAETAQKVKAILDGKAASARLDGAKAELKEKRRVIDAVYGGALQKLCALDKEDSLKLAEKLLKEYAEEGDEIAFASSYKFSQEVMKLDVVKKKKLKMSHGSAKVEGGFILLGKDSDKDVSYSALLAADREQFQSDIAVKIFKD